MGAPMCCRAAGRAAGGGRDEAFKAVGLPASVILALEGYVKIKFQAEQPDDEPAKSVMQRFDAVGLPAYVILKPKPAGN